MPNLMLKNFKVYDFQSHFERALCDVIPSGVEKSKLFILLI